MEDKVSLTRAKSAEFLEKLVQCSVCLDRPANRVLMCLRGHHLCRSCRDLLSECPICKCDFSDLRNFVVEELCTYIGDIIPLLLEPQHFNSTPMMTPFTSSESIAIMQTDVPMIRCRIGSCPDLLPSDCMYHHVRVYHIESLFEVNTKRENDGSSCSKIWNLKYVLNKFYDLALYTEGLGLFFVNLYINENGDLLAELRMANPRRDEKLYYEMALYVPGKDSAEECGGTVQECSSMHFQACEYKKRFFACYFEADFVTLNNRREEPFTLSLYIHH